MNSEMRTELAKLRLQPDDLSILLQDHPVASCIMNAEDVLTEFGLDQDETGESDDAHAARLAKAEDWLFANRKHIEEAMSRAGFEAIGTLGEMPQPFKLD